MNITIHFSIIEHQDHVALVRTDIPFSVGGDVYERTLPVIEALKSRQHLGLLLDLRSVAAGVGPDFERQITKFRREVTKGHPRIAFLVETPLGRLQVSRQLREDEAGSHIRVFSDEKPARDFARNVLDTSPYGQPR